MIETEPKRWQLEDITPAMTEEACRRVIEGDIIDMIVVYPPCLWVDGLLPGEPAFEIHEPFLFTKIRMPKPGFRWMPINK